MDSITIEKILNLGSRTSKIFKGCFPCDLLPQPEKLDYPAALIINLETHQFEGSHWVAVFAHGLEKEVYYFDSLALPIKKTIADFLGAFPNLIKNSHAYQNLFSHTCAHYCICFIYFLSIGYEFNNFLNMLSKQNNSDEFVRHFVNKMIE